jgi:hypothetical protein
MAIFNSYVKLPEGIHQSMESWGQRLDEDGHSNAHVDVIPAVMTAIWKFNQLTGLVLTAHFCWHSKSASKGC